MKCFDCQLYACPGCYWSTTRRCNTCQTVNINVFNYEAISKLPIKVLRSYVSDVVGMTKVDMDRSLTEKTDFVDKILQFKGLKPQKSDYLASIHHTTQRNENPENNTNPPTTRNNLSSQSPILSENTDLTAEATEAGIPESPRSSISTNSGGFPMVEDDFEDEVLTEVIDDDAMLDSESEVTSDHTQIHVEERSRRFHSSKSTPQHALITDPENLHNPQIQRLNNYSVKELKNFLAANNVNFQGVLEKHELLAKAIRLVRDKQNNERIFKEQTDTSAQSSPKFSEKPIYNGPKTQDKDENEDTGDIEKDVCKICWDATIDCVLLECGHMATCTSCAKKLNECPICRENVVRCVHVFRV